MRHTKEAVETVTDVFTPEPGARRVDVTLSEYRIAMPGHLEPGRTAFVVKNEGNKKHNFEIRREGMAKKFLIDLSPGQSKVLHVDLEHGEYTVFCPIDRHREKGMETKFTVR